MPIVPNKRSLCVSICDIMRKKDVTTMIVLAGASASGKTEIAKKLYQAYGYTKCITTTTRNPRLNEVDGKDYHFLTEDVFLKLMNEHAFYEVTTYNGYHYGIQKKDVNVQGVVIVDPNGANALIDQAKNDVFVVYVETKEEERKKRMIARGDHLDQVYERLQHDAKVFKRVNFKRIDLVLTNEAHSLDELAEDVHQAYQSYLKHHQITT